MVKIPIKQTAFSLEQCTEVKGKKKLTNDFKINTSPDRNCQHRPTFWIGDIYSVDHFLYVAVNKYLYKYSVH